jgi:signal peptidase II
MMAAGSMQRRGLPLRLAFLTLVALLVIGADRVSKLLAINLLYRSGARSVPILGDYIRLTYVENRGAAFGVLQNQTAFFILVGIVVIGVIIASFRYMSDPGWLLIFALGLQMGGAIGNLIDRVSTGYVVDFIDLTFWPVFNIADSAIVVGVALLAYLIALKPSGQGAGTGDG